ncbi:MAG: oligopeptide/dipeptide ABC transporter ATP-binding protein [Variibacter sp.]
MTDAPTLALQDLALDYLLPRENLFAPRRFLRAVDGVSFAIPHGGALGLVGESGCGKTSIAKMVMGLEKPTAGRIRILDRDIATMPSRDLLGFRRHFQMVFQDPYGSLDPRHTVGRIVAEPMRTGWSKARQPVEAALEAVGLSAADARKYPHQFSGGQRQRIAIARALVTRPELVVADEPVSALDLSVQAQVLNLLCDLRETLGLTYLFISHDLAVVEYVCDEIVVMFAGRIVERGAARTVLNTPAHPYTITLRDAMPRIDSGGRRHRARPAATKADAPADRATTGCPYVPRCPRAIGRCRTETPLLRPLASGQEAACHVA